ncbi:cytochrome c [Colwellia marinimaniae]|uniref:Cytochrome c n=1 Tax=Colwellia marinimaniae TaxID=1513592 RepID=A0ABQ0MRW6_9GAMM|nr:MULTISPECIES: c-type cytochrome [Colwellia]GAW95116.1 cytochrome c [Colwellia marinimaniae]
MKKIIFSLLVALSSVSAAQAADANAGKEKAAVCSACHGPTGVSASPIFPNLAGQNDAYIIKQLKDFKSGARTDAMMAPMAANLSDADMADLAAHFSGLPSANEQAAASASTGSSAETAPSSAAVAGNVEVLSSTPAAAIYAGNVAAGKNKAVACAACHGADGNSPAPMYPSLAGQSANYLAKQLADFKSGARKDPVMAGMVAALSKEDINDLAAFFAVQSTNAGTGESNEAGHKLYFGGDAKKGVTACIACHGVAGKGMKQAGFPSITGQSKDYLKKQLASFRDASRSNDNNGIMRNIAIKLSDADIEAVAQYITSLK